MSVDLGTVTSGANWLLERQGSGGEWGEVEMFPDLDQVLLLLLFLALVHGLDPTL